MTDELRNMRKHLLVKNLERYPDHEEKGWWWPLAIIWGLVIAGYCLALVRILS
jgi:hypothetical protein